MPNNRSAPFLLVVIAAIVALAVSLIVVKTWQVAPTGPVTKEHAYTRVLQTGTLRVGYVAYPPATIVDASGKRITGIFPALLEDIASRTGLRVEFAEEVGWATLIEGLDTGRYDIVGGLWANPSRGKAATVSAPVYFSGVGVWVRPDESRITPADNWESINRPDIRIAAIDGSTPLSIAKTQFPKATLTTYPNLTSESQLFLDLVSNKIDVFFAEPAQGMLFLQANPNSIRNIASTHPIRVFANVFLMRKDEFQFKNMIDTAIADLQSSGRVAEVLREYEPIPGAFYRVAPPYAPLDSKPD